MVELFSVPAFFILFRETLEASIILSVMLALINKIVPEGPSRKRMKRQVWLGVSLGLGLCLVVATVFLSLYYTVAKEAWDEAEAIWQGVLGLVSAVLSTLMALSMVRADTWREKWEKKLTKVTVDALSSRAATVDEDAAEGLASSKKGKYTLFFIPFTVVLREGVEAVIFLGGIGLEGSGTAYPIPAVVGSICGIAVGYLLYKGGNRTAFKYFLNVATVLLLVIAAGLFVGSVHEFEEFTKKETFVWKLDCCDQRRNNIWALLNTLVGWRDEATQGTLGAYISYWLFVVLALIFLRWKWRREAQREAAKAQDNSPTMMAV